MSSGKSAGHARSDIETIGAGNAAASSSSAADVARITDARTSATSAAAAAIVERLALVVDRCRRHAGFDQLDPPAVHDLVIGRTP